MGSYAVISWRDDSPFDRHPNQQKNGVINQSRGVRFVGVDTGMQREVYLIDLFVGVVPLTSKCIHQINVLKITSSKGIPTIAYHPNLKHVKIM